MTIRPPAFALVLALAAPVAGAQQPTAASTFASLVGVVMDSIRGGPLVGARVTVVASDRSATTNINGVFRIDSITPGEHQIVVTHPLLDTLGLQILSQSFSFVAGEQRQLGAHTPSFEEIRVKSCPRGGAGGGSSILVGRVNQADTDGPAAGATVSLVFTDATAKEGVEKVRRGRVGADGMFAICGLPSTIVGNLQASLGGATTPDLPIKMNDESMATAILSIGGSGAGSAVLRGKVTTMVGAPVGGVQVAIVGTAKLVTTADDGTFTLSGLPSGTQQAVARKIGFAMSMQVIQLSPKTPNQVTIILQQAQVLATVRVVGKLDPGLDKIGFTARKKLGAGWFMTPDQITAKDPQIATDVLRSTNGLRVLTEGTGRFLATSRQGGCINMFIDHARFDQFQPGDLDDAAPVGDLGAIEFYPSGMSTPVEFAVPSKDCATLVIWTKTLLSGQKQKP